MPVRARGLPGALNSALLTFRISFGGHQYRSTLAHDFIDAWITFGHMTQG
jgi:hypothetical protein